MDWNFCRQIRSHLHVLLAGTRTNLKHEISNRFLCLLLPSIYPLHPPESLQHLVTKSHVITWLTAKQLDLLCFEVRGSSFVGAIARLTGVIEVVPLLYAHGVIERILRGFGELGTTWNANGCCDWPG